MGKELITKVLGKVSPAAKVASGALSRFKVEIFIVIIAIAFYSGFEVRGWKEEAARAKAIEKAIAEYIDSQVVSDVIEAETNEAIEGVENEFETIKTEIVYVNNCNDDEFLRLYNESVEAVNSSTAP